MVRIQEEMTENGRFLRLFKPIKEYYTQSITLKSCSTSVLNFLYLFQISGSDSFLRHEAHNNRFIKKMLEIFAVWFTFTRFDR